MVERGTYHDSEESDRDPQRVVALEGGHNFRDLGGYRTAAGARIHWGRVFRSGTMAELTPQDQQRLAQLGIKLVCDLRSNRERKTRPTRWPTASPVEIWTRDHESSVGELLAALHEPNVTAEAIRQRMLATYRALPYEQADSYREVIDRIAAGHWPVVFHCAAGKDRTGVIAALLLSALDVPRETVIRDYLLTERFFERGCRLVRDDPSSTRLRQLDPRIWEPMMRAERAYIEAAFDTLEQRHGSIDGYLLDVLGIDSAVQSELRRQMLA